MLCQRCWQEFPAKRPRKWCPACKPIVDREKDTAAQRYRRALRRKQEARHGRNRRLAARPQEQHYEGDAIL